MHPATSSDLRVPQAVSRRLTAADGVAIDAQHETRFVDDLCGAAVSGEQPLCYVLAHGFTGRRTRPALRAVVRVLRRHGGVVTFDFRGHGTSEGETTVGGAEVLDLEAAVGWARSLGYARVVTVGFSMGAAVAVRHGGLYGGVDAVVAVSGPSRWHYRGSVAMRRLHVGVRTRAGRRFLARVRNTRVSTGDWYPCPAPPDSLAGRIAPTPLLVVHGTEDHYFPLDHARWLVWAAGPTAELWIEPGFGHSEGAATGDLIERIGHWVLDRQPPE